MYTRKRIYKQLKKRLLQSDNLELSLFSFYSEIMTSENTGNMVEHFQSMIDSIIEEGTAIPVPERQMAKRKLLGLPEFAFDREEIKTIVKKPNTTVEE
jgi:CRISPR/Cas system-associated protein endoribonuclease Cas2